MYEVVCVGVLCADVLAKPLETLPEEGKLRLINQLQLQVGGCAANVSIDLTKIGIKTAIIGKIGQDSFGKYLLETLKQGGLYTEGINIDSLTVTSASVVMISEDGERTIIHCSGSNAEFSFNDIDLEMIKNGKVLFIAGTFLMPQFDGYGTAKLLKYARDNGVVTCMDTAWDPTGRWMELIRDTLAYLDWFMPSYEEAKQLSNAENPEDMADCFISKGAKNIVIKLGKDGCFVKQKHGKGFFVPAYKDVYVKDTSGAGDSFCAGFITGLLKGWGVIECAKFANAVATHCIMEIGTTFGIKSMEEILDFMKNRN